MSRSRWIWIAALIGAAVLLGLVIFLRPVIAGIFPSLPPAQRTTSARWLEQNWSTADRYWYHHASQGTSTIPIPYQWFIALEQPKVSLFHAPGLIIQPDYMSRMGFIPSLKAGEDWKAGGYQTSPDPKAFADWGDGPITEANPAGLPVGFAITKAYRDPSTGQMLPDQVGLTCAACHTGHLEYNGTSLRIDGANAATSLPKLTSVLGASLLLTDVLPWRFDRFADRVLGPGAPKAAKDQLQAQLKGALQGLAAAAKATGTVDKGSTDEGFNRIDALNRIGNQVFYGDLVAAKPGFDPTPNYVALTAPVKFPPLWDTPWFIWAQYDGSIMQPIVRNAGEAIGVSAKINLTTYNQPDAVWRSSINFEHLRSFEKLLAGPNPLAPKAGAGAATAPAHPVQGFSGLHAPKWPADVLGPIDPALAARGRVVYANHCQACHMPPIDDPSQGIYNSSYWTTPTASGQSFLKVTLVNQAYVGTDPNEEQILINRKVMTPPQLAIQTGVGTGGSVCFDKPSPVQSNTSFAQGLAYSVQKALQKYVSDRPGLAGMKDKVEDDRPNCIQAKPAYKARPLDGIWATPPYLHNGSVPSLYALLSPTPEKDRPKSFCLGNRAYDPKTVGLNTAACPSGTSLFDVTKPGNSNVGHEFRDGPRGKGVIGPALSDPDRAAVIEFLKTQ
jgi:hypothetical protein